MLMVIFGAGASHDSASDFPLPHRFDGDTGSPWRPPLANDLFRNPSGAFGDIVKRYEKLPHILPFLRKPMGGRSVEEELEILRDQGGDERIRELAAVQYYLRDLLFESTKKWLDKVDGVTNYSPLIGDILRFNKDGKPVCLVTFNYDLLLDRALQSYGCKRGGLKDKSYFSAHPVLKLFKPHGSVDWVRFVDFPTAERISPNALIEIRETVGLCQEWAQIGRTEEADHFGLGRTVFPAISIPLQNKTEDTFAWPPCHLEYFKELLPSVTKILIIGWRAREAHFLNILFNSGLPLLLHLMVVGCNQKDAQTTLEYFVKHIGKRIGSHLVGSNCTAAVGGFSEFILNREAEDFLSS